jgi:hypothetical protein
MAVDEASIEGAGEESGARGAACKDDRPNGMNLSDTVSA